MREFHRGPYETAVGPAEMLDRDPVPDPARVRQRLREGRAPRRRLGGRRGRRRRSRCADGDRRARRHRADRGRSRTSRRPTPRTRCAASRRGGGCSPRPARLAAEDCAARDRPARPGRLQAASRRRADTRARCAGRAERAPRGEADDAGHDDGQRRGASPARSSRGCCSCTSSATTLGLTGTHWGCDTSNCGTCVVLMDGEPVKSCTVLAAMADGHEIRTVEGLEATACSTRCSRASWRSTACSAASARPG